MICQLYTILHNAYSFGHNISIAFGFYFIYLVTSSRKLWGSDEQNLTFSRNVYGGPTVTNVMISISNHFCFRIEIKNKCNIKCYNIMKYCSLRNLQALKDQFCSNFKSSWVAVKYLAFCNIMGSNLIIFIPQNNEYNTFAQVKTH